MKRFLSLTISLLIILSAVTVPYISAFAADSIDVAFHEDAQVVGDAAPESAFAIPNSTSKKYGGKTYYTEGKQLYNAFRNQLLERKSSIVLYLLSENRYMWSLQFDALEEDLFGGATDDRLATRGDDGDYLRWAKYGWSGNLHADKYDKYYYYTVTLNYVYFDTAAQEKQVNTVIANFINSLDTNKLSDYDILKRVHDFICDKSDYCYDAVSGNVDNYKYAYSPYGTLVKGSSVCQGYALAFYRICRELGYKCRYVSSTYYSGGSITGHAWNIVEINGKYYYVDTTWDDNLIDEGYPELGDTFLLVNYDTIRKLDTEGEHVPDSDYDTEYYQTVYGAHIDDNNYDSTDETLLSNCIVSLSAKKYTYSGSAMKPTVTVTMPSGETLTSGDYKLTYSSNTNTGAATVKLSGLGAFASSVSRRLFYITPKSMGKLKLQSGSRTASSLTLSWTALGGSPDGYYIEQYKGGKWTTVKTVSASATSAKISSLSAATTYSFRIRAYKKPGSITLCGAYSPTYKNTTKPKKPTATLKTSKKSITATWKKVTATGYEVQIATSSNFKKGSKKYTIKKNTTTSKKITKLKKGKKYYIRIRAYKTVGSTKYYSDWSKTKSIKCK